MNISKKVMKYTYAYKKRSVCSLQRNTSLLPFLLERNNAPTGENVPNHLASILMGAGFLFCGQRQE